MWKEIEITQKNKAYNLDGNFICYKSRDSLYFFFSLAIFQLAVDGTVAKIWITGSDTKRK